MGAGLLYLLVVNLTSLSNDIFLLSVIILPILSHTGGKI